MALIECTECGKMISDKASACPHCGCPVEKKLTCEECGQQLSANDTVCPYCGCPINETTTECEITNNNDIEDKTCKQGRRINVTRIVQIVLVCLLVSGGGYWLLSDRTVKGNDNELAADNALAADIDSSAIRYEEEIRRQEEERIRQEEEKQRKEEERIRQEEERKQQQKKEKEMEIMIRLHELGERGNKAINEMVSNRNSAMYWAIKANLMMIKDEQIELARQLGDEELVRAYQQQKKKFKEAASMIENGYY